MTDILSRDEYAEEVKRCEEILHHDNPEVNLIATIHALATVLNAHPENPTELTAHEELVDLLMRKGWIT